MFSAVKPLINREIFSTITKLFFFGESSSFSCEKTILGTLFINWQEDKRILWVPASQMGCMSSVP